jgi:hypothetical protein
MAGWWRVGEGRHDTIALPWKGSLMSCPGTMEPPGSGVGRVMKVDMALVNSKQGWLVKKWIVVKLRLSNKDIAGSVFVRGGVRRSS